MQKGWFETIWDQSCVVFDFETTNTDFGNPLVDENQLVTVCWFLVHNRKVIKEYYVDFREHPNVSKVLDALWADITKAGIAVSHNIKFEAGWLNRYGYPVDEVFWYDTMLGEKCIQSNRPGALTLEASIERRYGESHAKQQSVANQIKGGVNPLDIPAGPLRAYNIEDVRLHYRLFLAHEKLLQDERVLSAACVKSMLAIVLAKMESYGLVLDVEAVLEQANQTRAELLYHERELSDILDFNVKSSPQKRKALFEDLGFKPPIDPVTNKPYVTDSGELSTDSAVLSRLKAITPEQERFLETLNRVIHLRDLKSKYLDKLEDCARRNEYLHFTFSQISTATQRLSSRGAKYRIQGQNIPRAIKNLFTAPPNYVIGEADHSTIEYTVAGFLGRDEAALHDLQSNVDAHGLTASIVFHGSYDPDQSPKSEANSGYRQAAKPHTFKPLYGGQQGTEREVAYYEWFKDKHKGITAEQRAWAESAVSLGYVRSPTGIKFYFPEARRTKYGVKGFTKISNYCIQYLATGEMSPIAVLFQHHMMRVLEMQSYMVNTVHDQSLTYVHEDEVEDYKVLAEFCFVDCVLRALVTFYDIEFDFPLRVEVGTGTHWKL